MSCVELVASDEAIVRASVDSTTTGMPFRHALYFTTCGCARHERAVCDWRGAWSVLLGGAAVVPTYMFCRRTQGCRHHVPLLPDDASALHGDPIEPGSRR